MRNDANTLEAAGESVFTAIIEIFADTSPVARQRSHQSANFIPHNDFDITIIWHNVDARSNFTCFRKESRGPIERILIDFARVLETGVLEEVISVNASKYLFCVTIACPKNKNEGIMDAIFRIWVASKYKILI